MFYFVFIFIPSSKSLKKACSSPLFSIQSRSFSLFRSNFQLPGQQIQTPTNLWISLLPVNPIPSYPWILLTTISSVTTTTLSQTTLLRTESVSNFSQMLCQWFSQHTISYHSLHKSNEWLPIIETSSKLIHTYSRIHWCRANCRSPAYSPELSYLNSILLQLKRVTLSSSTMTCSMLFPLLKIFPSFRLSKFYIYLSFKFKPYLLWSIFTACVPDEDGIPLGDAIVASLHHFIPALTTSHFNCLLTCTVLPTGLSSLKKQLVTHLCILSSYHPTATRQSNYIRMFQEMYLYPNITWPILSEQRRLWSLDHFAPTAIPSQNQNHVKIYYFINPSEIFRAWKKSSLCRAQEKSSLYLKIVKW